MGHQLRQGGGGIPLHQLFGVPGQGGQGRQAQGVLRLEHQPGHGRRSAVCDGSHIDHEGAGVGQVVVLPHAGPAQLVGREAVKIEGAGGGVQAADPVGGGEPRPDGVLLQHVLPQLVGQQGKHPVARVGQSGGDVLFPRGRGGR